MTNFILHEKRLTSQQRRAITMLILPDEVPGGNMLSYLANLEKVFLAFKQDNKPRGLYLVIRKDGEKPRLRNPNGVLVMES